MQALEEYLSYWGFSLPPFSLAPQPSMFYVGGQYYEALEKFKYALRTKRGGGILVSEDAGLGKTTLILKLIEEAKELYAGAFRYVFIEHPSFDAESIIASVVMEITSSPPRKDKFLNLKSLRDFLIELHISGGHSLIVIDEAHLFKNSPLILQELRMLMNMTYDGEHLHTLILSGLKDLWYLLSSVSEFWQRLTIRCYLIPLSFQETKNLVSFRIEKAGSQTDKIFNEDALLLIHRLAKGCPRTILALCDFSLLLGFQNRAKRIGEKEVLKAYETLCGRTDTGSELRLKTSSSVSYHTRGNSNLEHRKKDRTILRISILLGILLFLIFVKLHLFLFEPRVDPEKPKINAKEMYAEKAISEKAKESIVEIKVPFANVRESPDIKSRRVAILAYGERLKVEDEKFDSEGQKWFEVKLYGQRSGWIAERVVNLISQDANLR